MTLTNKYPCKIRITKKILKKYINIVLGNSDVFVIVSEFVVLLARNKIWKEKCRKTYDLHKLNGNYKGIFDIHLPINQDLLVLFKCNKFPNPTKAKIKYIGNHDVFKSD